MRHTLFISDLHLDEKHQQSYQTFAKFLRLQALNADALYILGDLFEGWFGDDDPSSFVKKVKEDLRQLAAQNIPIYFTAGNRDLLIGKRFAKQTGCKLLPEFAAITLYGKNVLLTHGDALCTLDAQHMKSRKYSRNKLLQGLVSLLPFPIRKNIGEKLRQQSRQTTQSLLPSKMDVVKETVLNFMQQYKTFSLIHGHTHKPCEVNYLYENKIYQRIVLGCWEHQGCALKWYANHKQELVFFK